MKSVVRTLILTEGPLAHLKCATLGQVGASATLGTLLMMESACLRHTEIPHTSALFSDFQYHFDKVARFYAHDPHDGRSYAAAARSKSPIPTTAGRRW